MVGCSSASCYLVSVNDGESSLSVSSSSAMSGLHRFLLSPPLHGTSLHGETIVSFAIVVWLSFTQRVLWTIFHLLALSMTRFYSHEFALSSECGPFWKTNGDCALHLLSCLCPCLILSLALHGLVHVFCLHVLAWIWVVLMLICHALMWVVLMLICHHPLLVPWLLHFWALLLVFLCHDFFESFCINIAQL